MFTSVPYRIGICFEGRGKHDWATWVKDDHSRHCATTCSPRITREGDGGRGEPHKQGHNLPDRLQAHPFQLVIIQFKGPQVKAWS